MAGETRHFFLISPLHRIFVQLTGPAEWLSHVAILMGMLVMETQRLV